MSGLHAGSYPFVCACTTEAEQTLRPQNVPPLTTLTVLHFEHEHGRWPTLAELMLTLLLRYTRHGLTWHEAAHWIVRATTEGDPPLLAAVNERYVPLDLNRLCHYEWPGC